MSYNSSSFQFSTNTSHRGIRSLKLYIFLVFECLKSFTTPLWFRTGVDIKLILGWGLLSLFTGDSCQTAYVPSLRRVFGTDGTKNRHRDKIEEWDRESQRGKGQMVQEGVCYQKEMCRWTQLLHVHRFWYERGKWRGCYCALSKPSLLIQQLYHKPPPRVQ